MHLWVQLRGRTWRWSSVTKYLRRYWYLCFLLLHSVYCGTRIWNRWYRKDLPEKTVSDHGSMFFCDRYLWWILRTGNRNIFTACIYQIRKAWYGEATGNVKVVNLTSNISALITFILAGKILWVLGLSASVFSIAGHYLGAHMVVKNGVKIIKPIILLVLALLLIKIVLGI